MKHILIILAILFLSTFLISCEKKNGQGTKRNEDGSTYVERFKEEKENGQGTYNNPNGSKYIGEHKDDQPNGQGTMSYPDGEKCEGEWVNGGFRSGKCYDKDGSIQYNYVNGEGIKKWSSLKLINKPSEITTHHPPLLISSIFSCDWR